jgi:hypothetical protein
MGTFSEIMKAGKHNTLQQPAREPIKKGKKSLENRAPSKNCNIVINITLLQSDIDDLREPAYSAHTIRVRESDVEILKDTVYLFRKNLKKHISQSDVARLAIRITQKLAASKHGALEEVMGQIK